MYTIFYIRKKGAICLKNYFLYNLYVLCTVHPSYCLNTFYVLGSIDNKDEEEYCGRVSKIKNNASTQN